MIKAVTLEAFVRHFAKQLQRCQDTAHAKVRATCFWALVEFHHALDQTGPILASAEAVRARRGQGDS
eukprot:9716147-Alexandrium_andersonii.AAC.1